MLRERSAALAFDDPINIQYTSGTTGFPKGATLSHHNILNNGFFVGEGIGYTEIDRVCLPVPLYHCFGMVMGILGASHTAPAWCCPLQRSTRSRRSLRSSRRPHLAVWRADDVHRRARPPPFRRVRPQQPAHRHHGGVAVSGRGHEAGRLGDAHVRRGDLLRDDGDVSGVDDDAHGRQPRAAHRDRGPRDAARRGDDRRPAHGRSRRARGHGRALHACLLGDARLLGRRGQDRRGARPCRLDAHRRSRGHGCVGLRERGRP